ncbi:MAG: HWE histidine kinase domain-containing protein, partial [Bauldia litoralis]
MNFAHETKALTEKDCPSPKSDRRRGGWPASRFLLLIVAAALLPSVLVSGVLIWDIAKRDRERRQVELQARAETMIQVIDQQISDSITVLQVLASSDSFRSGNFAGFHDRITGALIGRNAHVLVLDAELNQILNTRVPFGAQLGKTSDPSSALAAAARGGPVVSKVFFGNVAREAVYNVVLPVTFEDEVRYFLIITRSAASLEPLLARTHIPAALVALLDQAGQVVAKSDGADRPQDGDAPLDRMFANAGADGRARTVVDAAGRRYLFVSANSHLSGWRVIKYVPLSDLNALLRESLGLLAGAALLTLMLSLAVTVWVTRRLTRPLKLLASKAEDRIDRSTWPSRDTDIREINIVAEALAEEAAERAQRVEHQRVLLREMAHRMQNQFAVVISILHQIGAMADSKDALVEAFATRLEGLSHSMATLAQEEWKGAPLRNLIGAHLNPLLGEQDERVRLHGP